MRVRRRDAYLLDTPIVTDSTDAIEIPNMTIQNVGPQDITASVSLADVYNAGQSINGRWAVQSCRPAVNTNGQIILTMHIGANDSDGYIFGISYHITAIGLPQQLYQATPI